MVEVCYCEDNTDTTVTGWVASASAQLKVSLRSFEEYSSMRSTLCESMFRTRVRLTGKRRVQFLDFLLLETTDSCDEITASPGFDTP